MPTTNQRQREQKIEKSSDEIQEEIYVEMERQIKRGRGDGWMDKNQREELKFQKYIALNVPNKVYTIRLVPYVKIDVIIYLAGAFNIILQKMI